MIARTYRLVSADMQASDKNPPSPLASKANQQGDLVDMRISRQRMGSDGGEREAFRVAFHHPAAG